jgi:prepilin-type N-terminal cleavage/methylation domain-containing protein
MILVESILTIWEDLIMNRKSRRGFTLAELLVVVAIIAVLTAVSIPIFTSQLDKSKIATNMANIKAAQNAAIVDYMSNDKKNAYKTFTYDEAGGYHDVGYYCYIVSSGTFGQPEGDNVDYNSVNGIYQKIFVFITDENGTADITSLPHCDASKTKLSEAISLTQGTNKFQ